MSINTALRIDYIKKRRRRGRGGGEAYSELVNSPLIWFDAQDLDLSNNSTLITGDAPGVYKNKGSLGAAQDAIQTNPALRMIYRTIATPGDINDLSALENDKTKSIATAIVSLAQPVLILMVFRRGDSVGQQIFFDGTSATRFDLHTNNSFTALHQVTTGVDALPGQSIVANRWEITSSLFQGATSWNRLNGAQSGNLALGTGNMDAISVFSGLGGLNNPGGFFAQCAVWSGENATQETAILAEALFSARYGAFPQ